MSAPSPALPSPVSDEYAADVQVLSASASLEISELTRGTLLLRVARDGCAARGPFAVLSLRVDHSFVSASLPLVLGPEAIEATLQDAMPDGYFALTSHSNGAVVLTVRRTALPKVPSVFCTSRDATLRARRTGPNRLALKGAARGQSTLVLRVDAHGWTVPLAASDTPLAVAERIRAELSREYSVLLGLGADGAGPVDVTILPRR